MVNRRMIRTELVLYPTHTGGLVTRDWKLPQFPNSAAHVSPSYTPKYCEKPVKIFAEILMHMVSLFLWLARLVTFQIQGIIYLGFMGLFLVSPHLFLGTTPLSSVWSHTICIISPSQTLLKINTQIPFAEVTLLVSQNIKTLLCSPLTYP